MPEENKAIKGPEEVTKSRESRPEVLLALIEHGSRPIATLIIGIALITWLFFVRVPLFKFLEKSKLVKVGSFEVQLREIADKANLNSELQALKDLNDEELQLFLIIGKGRDQISYVGQELTENNLKKLKNIGLVSNFQVSAKGEFEWSLSDKGVKLHSIITNLILTSIRLSASTET